MISKRLLKEIVNEEIIGNDPESIDHICGKAVAYQTPTIVIGRYNVYQLANKCKEWAFEKKKETIQSLKTYQDGKQIWYATTTTYFEAAMDGFYAETEPEAIFKACEWLIDNKKNKGITNATITN